MARSGRPGPVVIDIPKDVSAARSNYSRLDHVSFPFSTQPAHVEQDLACEAVQQILNAKRPVLYVGGGIVNSGAVDSLLSFAELLRLPVTPTLMGLGDFRARIRWVWECSECMEPTPQTWPWLNAIYLLPSASDLTIA